VRVRPRRWPGVLVGAGLLLLLLALDLWLVLRIAQRGPDLIAFLLGLVGLLTLPLLIALGYGLYGFVNLVYDVNRDRVLIRWIALEQVIPMGRIIRIVKPSQAPGLVRWRRVRWPGYVIGQGVIDEEIPLLSFATEPLSCQLLLITPSHGYLISPPNQEEFLRAFEARRRMGALRAMREEMHPAPVLAWPVWYDRMLWGLISAGVLANMALLAYLCWRYANLPPFLPMHFDPWRHPDRIGTRGELFRLPLIGFLYLAINSTLGAILSSRQRTATFLLLVGAIVVQSLLGAALWALTH